MYAGANPATGYDPSGLETLAGLETAESIEGNSESSAIELLQGAFDKFGCDLAVVFADQAVTSGVYVLIDYTLDGFYIGQSVNMNSRYKQHLREAEAVAEKAWKANLKPLLQFPIFKDKSMFNKVEQLMIDVLKKAEIKIFNVRAVIGSKNVVSEAEYAAFKKLICPGL